MPEEKRIPIASDVDIVAARQEGRSLAAELGFSPTDAVVIATAISELARNIVQYARVGEIVIRAVREGVREGIVVVARDDGPGIPDIEQAMQDGFSTGGGLGFGLPGVKRLMDTFEIKSRPGAGTTVTVAKWRS